MQYKQIRPKKIYEQVAEALIEMIRNEALKPGDRLDSVQQLAENFNVGRSAVREALSALRAMGLVEMRQGEGTYLKAFDPEALKLPIHTALLMKKKDIENLLEVRKVLEAGTVEAAAVRRSEDDLIRIKTALEEMKIATGNEELGEKADFDFHMAIARASGNNLLVSLLNNVSEMMISLMRETRRLSLYSEKSTWERLYDQHSLLYDAIKSQHPEAARAAIFEHLGHVEKILMDAYEKNKSI
ncbi:FadR/GntR family transcriptional regulator [Bacillus marinisedimentorum]|uniref:FadR/GntR family transcriptional regulator n=1 Tax=Bacillus marinisedimentorum TaxID=1821260 RepID=UPI000871F600|nr:FadR/GntR family transcriptional regulator [Bacillus marinisedimentorum]